VNASLRGSLHISKYGRIPLGVAAAQLNSESAAAAPQSPDEGGAGPGLSSGDLTEQAKRAPAVSASMTFSPLRIWVGDSVVWKAP
jgi:hypothetical protein